MNKSTDSYNLGFTAFGLGAAHSYALAAVYQETRDWVQAKEEALNQNVFRQSKASSISRLEREFRLRLQTLTCAQLDLLVDEPSDARIPISLLAVFKRYRIIRDFAQEVLFEKIQTLDFELRPSDYSSFIEHKETAHPELMKLSDTSAKKIKQVTLRILTEGEILSASEPPRIAPVLLPDSVVSVIRSDDPALLRPFLQA